ncbi:hypothetical protein A3B21_03360 [Candidatus Uhrbacteria bacterium RIFCSPLOWO2_01_FULL_47_24]|uniref:Serine protease n=1 Tax=Candidatus Uhrbacteria bacterium RIFCSPLOWO2_01_FULL_47_24 TaxID=1802401 RepID=A0A1F7USZ1_9BACT|nr:MAG: hypothetical protein A2753_05250 [Candidatus Uhrbacteria bacterium RIFCSPHIGHO2_01_FULL_47_11]OGL69053.1 MAG: hypothetical protein A3D58_04030 [Candidatus Uhrbacteria bacterium RIFCSPHIGHO2_02_FULL_46_47]OGL74629.1 MAG: hypothetical protein A3F52_01335 [Candidatus Uhrbacteria bacterium RIFCSPHIGHO2_12_FULL_47_11]OGL81423.1 MAG: hypothetical protein A3B21_03360 [Candidatus Uhrbacteria bacterium RIFCSPLOWO2_01_FULL_47_24]OGL83691.1 MAG: hypothetical protein A3J03_01530 [Candidatus Uhrbact
MKNYLKIGLLLILALVPLHSSQAITQTQINSLVHVVCPGQNDTWFSGSGTIIDSKGIVLTNKHVVTDQSGNIIRYCAIGLTKSISRPPSFDYTAEVKYYTTDENLDAAILYIDNKNNTTFPSVNAFSYDTGNLKLGDGIEVIGYPSIGGNTVTYVNGVMSGIQENYIKTTAPLEHGNSGGSAYTFNGDFIGVPTAVVAGSLNSLSYVLDVNKLKIWLQSMLGSTSLPVFRPDIQSNITVSKDVTPPDASNAIASVYNDSQKSLVLDFSNSQNSRNPYFEWSGFNDPSGISGYYVYFGSDINAKPITAGVFTNTSNFNGLINTEGIYYLIIQAQDEQGNITNPVYWNYHYQISPPLIELNPLGRKINENRPTKIYIYSYDNGMKGDLLKIIYLDISKVQPVSIPTNSVYIEWDGINDKDFIIDTKVRFKEGRTWSKCSSKGDIWWNLGIEPGSKEWGEWNTCNEGYRSKEFVSTKDNFFTLNNLDLNKPYNFEMELYIINNGKYEQADGFHIFSLTPTKTISQESETKNNSLTGRILLQVESHGEAWYIYPGNQKRYYLGRPADAFNVMRKLGLGAKHDLIMNTTVFPVSLAGKILLDVESHGEAYYIYPKDRKKYYLGRPDDAFNVMRNLGLGISNTNLNKILVAPDSALPN